MAQRVAYGQLGTARQTGMPFPRPMVRRHEGRSNMIPCSPRSYFPDVLFGDAKSHSKLLVGEQSSSVQPPEFNNIVTLEYRASITLPLLDSARRHVSHVVKVRPHFQMGGITASFVSNAGVQNPFSCRNISSVRQHPSNSMRGTVHLSVAKAGNSKRSITTCPNTVLPRPTFIWTPLVNFRPKESLKFCRKYSRDNFGRDTLCLHNSVVLICATLSGEPTPRGHFHFSTCV